MFTTKQLNKEHRFYLNNYKNQEEFENAVKKFYNEELIDYSTIGTLKKQTIKNSIYKGYICKTIEIKILFNELHQIDDLTKNILLKELKSKIKNFDKQNFNLYIIHGNVSMYKTNPKTFIGLPKSSNNNKLFSYENSTIIMNDIYDINFFLNKKIPDSLKNINNIQFVDYWKDYNIVKEFKGELKNLNPLLEKNNIKEISEVLKIFEKDIEKNFNDIIFYTDEELEKHLTNIYKETLKKVKNSIKKNTPITRNIQKEI